MLQFRALASATIVFLLALCVSSVMATLLEGHATSVSAIAGSMDAMSIDMDPSTSPANTATTLGSRETCARINENNTLDADEDAEDALTVDITATNIPTTNKMIAFAYELDYPTDLNVTAKNHQFLLNSGAGSSTLDASESLPDSDGAFNASAADTSSSASSRESGSGVLHRIELSTIPTAGVGIFPLTIAPGSAAHVDPNNNSFPPNNLENASVAINRSCPLPPVDIELVSLSLVSVSGPTVPTGTPFNLQVTAMATSHGPNPADIRFDLNVSAPGDCTLAPPTNQTEDFLNVAPSASRTSIQTWTANCSTPSAHAFSASGTVSVIGLAEESNPANNGPLNDGTNVAVTASADPKVTGVTVNSPTDAATGAPFNVSVTATLHNNGPFSPINVDTTLDLPMPSGCSRSPNNAQTIDNSSLVVSTPVNVQANWSVSCSTTGLKTFAGTGTVALDQLHITDSDGANNTAQGQDTTDTSLAQADVKVTSVTVTSPASSAINTNFPVTVSTIVHNNGPYFPVNADIHLTLNLPADCFTPVTTIDFQNASLGPSVAAQLPDVTFYVACINHSFHNITATGTIVVDDPLAGDPNPGNNTLTSAAATIAIIRTADFKAVSASIGGPISAIVGTPFNVTVDATLHNNGPDSGPVDALITLNLPPDCTAPANSRTVSTTLPVSTATAIPTQTFAVTCTSQSTHSFDASVSLSTPLHVVDPGSGNNSAATGTATLPVLANSDLKVTAVSVTGPPSPQAGVPFSVTATATLHNNGPFGPTNVDTTVALNLPGDCSTPDANPRAVEDTSLGVSTAVAVPVVWSVTCTAQSNHSFTGGSSVVVDQLHVQDPTPGNNANTSPATNIPIFTQADGKITSSTVLSPPTFIAANTNVPITIRKVLHNNGPFGPTTFSLTKSTSPVPGCTITAPPTSNHNLAVSTATIVDEVWTVNCVPGSYTFNFSNTLSPTALHVTDPNSGNNTAVTTLTVTVDTDGDGIPDDVENACGSNPNNGNSIPERIDGSHAGVDDDLDTQIDEPLPAGAANFDCDRDGYTGTVEGHVYTPSVQGDQDPCGTNNSPPTSPPSPIGWPADLVGGGIPDSTNRVNILDITSFLAPVRFFNTNVGSHTGDVRWDLVPGKGLFAVDINIQDLSNLLVVTPPMLAGPRALNGPACPFPP